MSMCKPLHLAAAAILASASLVATAAPPPKPFDFEVKPWTYDPAHSNLVSSTWVDGLGCPTLTNTLVYDTNPPYALIPGTYGDPGCPTGASEDKKNKGLLLSKTGPLYANASGGASLDKVKGIILSELGYDVRGHCGGGAPRFDITTTTGKSYFLACTSPAPTSSVPGTDWTRLRWGTGAPGSVMAYLGGVTLEAIKLA